MTRHSYQKGGEQKKEEASRGRLFSNYRNSTILLGRFRLKPVIGQRQTRLVAVAGILVQHALGDRAVNRRHCGMQQITYGRRISSGDRCAHALHETADARAIRAIYISALARLRGTLQY